MNLCAPFVRWARLKNPSMVSRRTTLFYLQTAQGDKLSCALAIRGPKNRITYRVLDSFLNDYREILPVGDAKEWRFGAMLAQSMEGVIYHSFVWCSEQGVANAWYLNYVAPIGSPQVIKFSCKQDEDTVFDSVHSVQPKERTRQSDCRTSAISHATL